MRANLPVLLAILGAAGVGFVVGRSSSSTAPSPLPPAPSSSHGAVAALHDAGAPKLLPLPLVRQSTEFTCGAAAVTSVLAYLRAGTELREADLQKLMHTREDVGTDPVNIVKTLGNITADGGLPEPLSADGVLPNDGTKTEVKDGVTIVRFEGTRGPPLFDVELTYRAPPPVGVADASNAAAPTDEESARDVAALRRALERRDAVLIDMQAWREDAGTDWATDFDDGHWVVLVGLDDENIYTMDPWSFEGYTYVPIPEFVARWHGEGTGKVKWQHVAVFVRGHGTAPPPASTAPLLRMD